MNLEPTEEQRQIVATVRRFVREEIVPLEAKLDPDASELPPEDFARLTKQVRDMGFWGLDIPAEYGGAGVDLVTRTLMAVEMAPAPRRPLRALLRRVRLGAAWPSSTRPTRTRSSAISIRCCAARSAASSA